MAGTYTLHVAPGAQPGDPAALERATLVRDGFSWGAFVAPGLWFFFHRHWVAGFVAFLVVFGFGFGLRAAGLHPLSVVAAEFLLHLLVGLEASSLRRWLYARRGRPAVDVVQAGSLEDAELRSFGRWLAPPDPARGRDERRASAAPARWRTEPVIGLFPDAEGRT